MRQVSGRPPTVSLIGTRRNSQGAVARQCAALGPTCSARAISSVGDRAAVSATCSAVIESTTGPPTALAAFVAARIRRITDRSDVKSDIIPTLCPAIARTSHSGQSVCLAQSSASSDRSCSTSRPYSSAASTSASACVIGGMVSTLVAVIVCAPSASSSMAPDAIAW